MKSATIKVSDAGPAAAILRAGYVEAHRSGRMVWLHAANSTWSFDTKAKADSVVQRGDGESIEEILFS